MPPSPIFETIVYWAIVELGEMVIAEFRLLSSDAFSSFNWG
jgi:hypothetical protein